MTNEKTFSVVKKLFFTLVAICFLASCQDDEMLAVSEDAETTAASVTESQIGSLTITGSNTQFAERVTCSTCTFVVDTNAEVIDGKELGLKAGAVVCLQTGVKYGNLEFTNLEGTADKPIIIGTCGN
jgi:hypothetical protein